MANPVSDQNSVVHDGTLTNAASLHMCSQAVRLRIVVLLLLLLPENVHIVGLVEGKGLGVCEDRPHKWVGLRR